jgi:hypothetical protein
MNTTTTTTAPAVDTTGMDAAMARTAETIRLCRYWERQPAEVREAWKLYETATNAHERHQRSAALIHAAARACKQQEPWARTPAIREAFTAAARAWDINEARRRQGVAQ